MRVKRIEHEDGSISYVKGNIVIKKNKEDVTEQKITEIEEESLPIDNSS